MSRRLLAGLICGALLSVAPVADAAWSANSSAQGEAVAATMPSGHPPTPRASGSSVTLSWSASLLPGGAAVEGYTIARYAANSRVSAVVGANCSGLVTTTSCTESGVPPGSWVYTVTPVQGGWHGAESAQSQTVVI
jgi:hypothetical protein